MDSIPSGVPSAGIAGLRTIELGAAQAPLLQRFFEANPELFLATTGEPSRPGDALEEITQDVPAEFSFVRKCVFGYARPDGELAAMANIIAGLIAPPIWHLGTFVVETSRHGGGDAQRICGALEHWASTHGALWMRLGVVIGNVRAERFWASQGYLPVRERAGVEMGNRRVTVRVMVKPLSTAGLGPYLELAPRDRQSPG